MSRVLEQAQRDGVSLSDVEQRMFLFSETSEAGADLEAQQKFDAECNSAEYEAKIAGLLRRAYKYERKSAESKDSWKQSLHVLREEDFYGLVMVDQAGIPRAEPRLGLFTLQFGLFSIVELAVIGIGTVLIFQPVLLHLVLADWVRLLLWPVFIGLMWLVAELFGYIEWAKIRKRAESQRLRG